MANSQYDLVVVGSGPGGYIAAIRASQLKMKVGVIERDRPGGVCLNWGCIPSKALLNSADAMETIRGAAREHGITTGEISFDFKRVIERSRAAADKLSRGVRFLFRKHDIDLIEAAGVIAGPHTVELARSDGAEPPVARLQAERILLATGSRERLFAGMTLGEGVMTSKEALLCDQLPQSLVVIGAGAVGLEFAYFYQAFGTKVTVVELEKQLLPGIDAEVAEELRRAFVKYGVEIMLRHGYRTMERLGDNWQVTLDHDGQSRQVQAQAVLVAVGRRPNSEEMGLENAGVEIERGGYVKVDSSFRTTCPSIFAIGDLIRPPLLAHKASAEGVAAVEIMAGVREPGFDLNNVPACIYCQPEVATVGLSEAEAQARGIEVKVGKFPFRANGKSVAINQVEGFVKIVAGKKYGEVLGCQIIGHHATDLISEVVLGKSLEATTLELGRAVHPHPTLSESIMEAALAADNESLNF